MKEIEQSLIQAMVQVTGALQDLPDLDPITRLDALYRAVLIYERLVGVGKGV